MSWIQKAVLLYLLRHENATIKKMKPLDVDANLFAYHLDKLLSDGYVEKVGRGTYTLTTQGQRLVGAFSTATNKQHEFIKTVVVLYSKTKDGKYLLFRWSRQPYMGKIGLLHDHMPLGKSLEEGIVTAMQDKLGREIIPQYMANVLIKIEHAGELISHMNALVYRVDLSGVSLPYESRNGTAFLSGLGEEKEVMDGLHQLLTSLDTLREPQEFTLSY